MGKWRYSSSHSQLRHWMGVSGQLHAPNGAPKLVLILWRREKSLASAGNRTRFLGRPAHSLVIIPAPI
jgi:hypothetical protein